MRTMKGKDFKKGKVSKIVSTTLILSMMATMAPIYGETVVQASNSGNLTAFEKEFQSPQESAKPFVRYWIAPGRMNEAEVRKEMKTFADGGYGGVELQCLELSKYNINSSEWNTEMKWILQAGLDYGLQVDCTVGQMWPIASPEVTDKDDERAEQQIFNASASFTATTEGEDGMNYHGDGYVYPTDKFKNTPYELVAITAAKKSEGDTYDASTAIDVLNAEDTTFDKETGELTWTAPSEGTWDVFYFYSQAAQHTTLIGQVVLDHMSADATDAVIKNWEDAMNSDSELKDLYERNGGCIFGDSFELRDNLWTKTMLNEFKERRGYDLTPYLPALYHDFDSISDQVKTDLYQTMTDLLTDNQIKPLNDWAETHGMSLRYQAYSSAGNSPFELTEPALATDIIEAESYAMSGDAPDAYRQLSGAVNMGGYNMYSVEGVEVGQDDWRTTWMSTNTKSGESAKNKGFMYYANRFFAAGVNRVVFHGATYKFTDTEGLGMPPWIPVPVISYPGYSAMSGMNYGNEWDDKTPMYENMDITLGDYVTRTQMVLQQGKADVDLAIFRNHFGKGNVQTDITAVEQSGYTYDYVTESILNLDNAVTGTQDGSTVLAADGPSYKAFVIEPLPDGTVPTMSLNTANKILNYAKSGLPVVIIGDAPSETDHAEITDTTTDATVDQKAANAKLVNIMNELKGLGNVKSISSRSGLTAALSECGVTSDAQPERASDVYYNHRHTDAAELYYIYNDGNKASTQKLTLKGTGTPYLLDPWSGEITPITEYKKGNGTCTIDIDLESMNTMMVAVAKDGWSSKSVKNAITDTTADDVAYDAADSKTLLYSTKGGTLTSTLQNGSRVTATANAAEKAQDLTKWTMKLNKWTEGSDVFTTKVEETKIYDLSETGLKPWYEIDPENLTNVAGVAEYKTTFALDKGWKEGQGAYLAFKDVSDAMRLFINDEEVPIDQISMRTDIGKYVKAGENTITAKVSSNMSNLKFGTNDSNTYAFGIMGSVTLTPYSVVDVSGDNTVTSQKVSVNKIVISGDSKTIAAGKKIQLKAVVTPSKATDKSVTWKSSNTKYATVSKTGKVTTKKAGKGKMVTITATAKDGSKKLATYKIKIAKGVVKKISITGNKILKAKKSLKLKAKVTGTSGAYKGVTWTSSNKKYATVNSKGNVTAKTAGKGHKVKITAKAKDGSGTKKSVVVKIK